MTTKVYMRHSKLGYAELFDNMAAFIGDAEIDVDDFCDRVVEKVNRKLPGFMIWIPHTSEILIGVDDDFGIELDDIRKWIGECAELVEAEYDSEVA